MADDSISRISGAEFSSDLGKFSWNSIHVDLYVANLTWNKLVLRIELESNRYTQLR